MGEDDLLDIPGRPFRVPAGRQQADLRISAGPVSHPGEDVIRFAALLDPHEGHRLEGEAPSVHNGPALPEHGEGDPEEQGAVPGRNPGYGQRLDGLYAHGGIMAFRAPARALLAPYLVGPGRVRIDDIVFLLHTGLPLMRPEQGLGEAAGLKEGEAQEHRVPHAPPDGAGNVVAAQGNIPHQHRVDPYTDHNEERLEAQGQQGAEIILPRVAPFPVCHRGKGDGTYRGHQIHLNHPPVDHQENTDREDLRTQSHEDALEPKPQQGADAPVRKLGLQVGGHAGYVDARVRNDDAGTLADHILRHIEHRHDDVPGVGDDEHRAEGLEDPLEEDPGVEVVEIVLFYDELDEFIAHDKGEDDAGDGDDYGLREIADHVENAAVPRGGRHTHLTGDLAHLGIQGIKHPGQVGYDTVDEQFLEPLLYRVKDQRGSPPFRKAPCAGASRGVCWRTSGGEQAGQQGDQGQADEGDTAAGHELFNSLRLTGRVVLTVTFQEVDAAPHAQAAAQRDHQSLQYVDSVSEKIHKSYFLSSL